MVPVILCICVFGPAVSPAHAAGLADKKAIVEHAREAHVNLRHAGLVEFRATVQPNWNLAVKYQLQRTRPERNTGWRSRPARSTFKRR